MSLEILASVVGMSILGVWPSDRVGASLYLTSYNTVQASIRGNFGSAFVLRPHLSRLYLSALN